MIFRLSRTPFSHFSFVQVTPTRKDLVTIVEKLISHDFEGEREKVSGVRDCTTSDMITEIFFPSDILATSQIYCPRGIQFDWAQYIIEFNRAQLICFLQGQ